MKVGRNELCPCGSGKKYKRCCLTKDEQRRQAGAIIDCNGALLTYTRAEAAEFSDEENIARHESAHAVAAWIVGLPIQYIQLNDDPSDRKNHAADLAGVTVTGISLGEMQAASLGARWVFAKKHAFVTLAGPFGGDIYAENPLRQHETRLHLGQALARITNIVGCGEDEARLEVARLLYVVDRAFRDPAIQGTVSWLAKNLIQCRRFTGDEITACIEQAHPVFQAEAAKLSAPVAKGKSQRIGVVT
jgi:hypothetical protein